MLDRYIAVNNGSRSEVKPGPATVSRSWRTFGLKPHRADTFKISKDPLFVDKFRDVVARLWSTPRMR